MSGTRLPAVTAPRAGMRGMTLVELMVGLAVGLFVSLIGISVFISTRTLNAVNTSGARMGENGRLAMEALQSDLRGAGFVGCQDPLAPPVSSVLNATAAANVGFLVPGSGASGDAGLGGHTGTGSGFSPALGTVLAGFSPSTNSDIVSVRVPVDSQGWGLTSKMISLTDAPQIGSPGPGSASTLRQGDIVLVSDCKAGDIFQITSDNPSGTGSLGHAAGGSMPGNAVASLTRMNRNPGTYGSDLSGYGLDAVVYRLQTRHYFVAPSVRQPGTRSLWRYSVPCGECTANPQELAAGVERLAVTWGTDTDAAADWAVNRYEPASGATPWQQVVSARVQMLVATTQNGVAQASAPSIAFAGSTVRPTDRRLRTVLTEVVALRNRAP